jgi:membrane-associated phospholipid phosphatase
LDIATPATTESNDASMRFRLVMGVLGIAHLCTVMLTGGLRPEHVIFDALFVGLPWVGPRCLAFTQAAFPIWITAVVVDGQRYLPLLGTVHTGDMYRLETSIFPGPHGLAWAEYLNAHPNKILDFFTGASYALFLYEFIGLLLFYFFVQRERFAPLAWAFFAANTLGAIVYMFCPVAPPWYVIQHGLGPAELHPLSSAAGCARFDALLGIHYFAGFYSRNPNVYGAMPSLHVAYPLLFVIYSWERGWKWRVPGVAFNLLVIFSAVYLAHHYILDVVAGLATAVASAWFGNWVARLGARRVEAPPLERQVSIV